MTVTTPEVRNATLDDLVAMLKTDQARKLDVVAPAATLQARGGMIVVKGSEAQLTDDGVTTVDGVYRPTEVFDDGVAEKLGIPVKYLRTLRTERPYLYDANVNGWLHGRTVVKGGERQVIAEPDARSFLVRLFSDGNGGGVARSMLSNRYGIMDNLDALTAMLAGIREAGATVEIPFCDLTERRMRVRVTAPAVRALAPTLLAGYRSPFAGGVARAGDATGLDALARQMGQDPIVFAGFELRNSEVGCGAYTIVPVMTVLVCTNGMTIPKMAVREVHTGARLDDGRITWAADTVEANTALIGKMTRDAVATFLSPEFLNARVADVEAKAATPVADPAATITKLGKALKFDETTIAGVLDHFIRGGQMTAGGVVNAITSHAQTVQSGDKAMGIEDRALDALALL